MKSHNDDRPTDLQPTMSADNATTAENDGGIPILLHQTSNPSAPRITIILPTDTTPPSSANTLRRLASDATTIPFDSLRLIYRGKIIAAGDDGNVVEEYKLEEGCVVHCLGKASASASAVGTAAASTTAAATTGTANTTSGSRPVGSSVIPPPAAAATSAPAAASSTATSTSSTPLQTALTTLQTSSPNPDAYATALTTLSKLLGNITSNSTVEKYRKVKRSNPAFQKRLGGLGGGHDVMLAVGFGVEMVEGVEHYVLVASAEAWAKLVESQKVVEEALVEAKRTTAGSAGGVSGGAGMGGAGASPFGTGMPPAGGGMGMGAGMPGMPGMPGMGGGDMSAMMNSPQMQAAAAEMMSNPQAIRSMLQNPMVRQMMENDPRFANNPMARMALERMTNDPQALQQMSRMMSDPSTRQMMMNMQNAAMNNNGGGGGMGAGMGGAGTGAAGTPPNAAQLAEQMRLMQQMMGAMGGAGAGGGSGMPPQPSSAGANNTTSGSAGQQQQQNNSNNSGNSGGGNDDEMTEEEMIQEAIRRSLNEN